MYIEEAYKGKTNFWRYLIPIVLFFGLMALNMIVMQFLDLDFEKLIKEEIAAKGSNRVFLENLIPFVIFLGALLFWVKTVHKQPIKALTTSRKKMDWGRVFFAFGLGVIFLSASILIDYYISPEDYLWNFNLDKFLILAAITVLLIPLQIGFEEYFFRGYLMQGFGVLAGNRWVPLIVTSVVFGGLHYFNPEVSKMGDIVMISYIGMGFVFGIMTLMDEGLELALGLHAANNMIVALLVTADWTAFQTESVFKDISEPTAGWGEILIPLLIFYPILLFIMAKKYGWSDWKNKLFGKVQKPETIKLSEES